jgi:SAM-dependent methyltransferase/DNA-binding transcriptional ArsR family regulator
MRIDDLSLGRLRDLADVTILVAAASDAGIFQALHRAPASPTELSEALGFDERATRITLLALEEAGLLERRGERFVLTERSARELGDPDAPDFTGRGLPHWLRSVRATTRLREVLERGGPLDPRPRTRRPEHVRRFTAAMSAAPRARIERIVDLCLERRPDAETVLDLGGGPGHITRTFVAHGLRGTLLDTADIVTHVVPTYGIDEIEGLEAVAADFNRDPLPAGPFDVVLLSNVVHIYDAASVRALFAKAARVLSPGGVLAVAEFLRGRSSRAAHLGLQMLLKSARGDAYSEAEIRQWMREAGLVDDRVDALDEDRHIVTALRP